MFTDVKELLPGSAERLQETLRQSAATTAAQSSSSKGGPAAPPLTHLSSNGQQTTAAGHAPERSSSTPNPRDPIPASNRSALPIPPGQPTMSQYLLLCVNTKRLRALEHVEVTSLMNDEHLFQANLEAYEHIRDLQTWKPILTWVPIPKQVVASAGGIGSSIPKSANSVKVRLYAHIPASSPHIFHPYAASYNGSSISSP